MEEEPVRAIRETSRNTLILNRRRQRDEETDVRRSLVNLRGSPSDIANKLKTKCAVTTLELRILKNALMNDSKYIEVVLSTHGALRGLVREISGHDISKQCEAAACCCNLALSDGKAGAAVAKAAGAYLISALDSLTMELAVTCAWTLGNLASSGAKACELLVAQGALPKLIDLMMTPDEDAKNAAVEALVHFTHQLKDDLRPEHLIKILNALSQQDITTPASRLLLILSCHNNFIMQNITEEYVCRILENLYVSIERYFVSHECEKLVYLLRVLANINNKTVYELVLNQLFSNNMCSNIKLLMESDVSESLFWLLGNMFNCCGDNEVFSYLIS